MPPQISGMVLHAYNPTIRKAETEEGPKFGASLSYIAFPGQASLGYTTRPGLQKIQIVGKKRIPRILSYYFFLKPIFYTQCPSQ